MVYCLEGKNSVILFLKLLLESRVLRSVDQVRIPLAGLLSLKPALICSKKAYKSNLLSFPCTCGKWCTQRILLSSFSFFFISLGHYFLNCSFGQLLYQCSSLKQSPLSSFWHSHNYLFLLHDTNSFQWIVCMDFHGLDGISGALQPFPIKRGQLQCYFFSLCWTCFLNLVEELQRTHFTYEGCGTLFCHDKGTLIFMLALKIHQCTRGIRKLEHFCIFS